MLHNFRDKLHHSYIFQWVLPLYLRCLYRADKVEFGVNQKFYYLFIFERNGKMPDSFYCTEVKEELD